MADETPPTTQEIRFGTKFDPIDNLLLIVGWYNVFQVLFGTEAFVNDMQDPSWIKYGIYILLMWAVYRFSKAWLFDLKPSLIGQMKS